jgi:hypothetical protein
MLIEEEKAFPSGLRSQNLITFLGQGAGQHLPQKQIVVDHQDLCFLTHGRNAPP